MSRPIQLKSTVMSEIYAEKVKNSHPEVFYEKAIFKAWKRHRKTPEWSPERRPKSLP